MKAKQGCTGFMLLEVLVASALFALVLSSAWFIAVHAIKTLNHNRRIHQEDPTQRFMSINDCRPADNGISLCARGNHLAVIIDEST